ncbi:hypothetical protein EV363DRAFT_1317207 [Boletus edulis]|nr:hypothetical protein EV363DRAFT_1317207 [Boletus edulis]
MLVVIIHVFGTLVYTRPSSARCDGGSGSGPEPEFGFADEAPDLVWRASGTALSARACDDSEPMLDLPGAGAEAVVLWYVLGLILGLDGFPAAACACRRRYSQVA